MCHISDPEAREGGGERCNDVGHLLFYYSLKIIQDILLLLLNIIFIHSDIINNSEKTS